MRVLEDPRYTVITASTLLMKLFIQPDSLGHWGRYGGRFVPETLMAPLEELTAAFEAARADESFQKELLPISVFALQQKRGSLKQRQGVAFLPVLLRSLV